MKASKIITRYTILLILIALCIEIFAVLDQRKEINERIKTVAVNEYGYVSDKYVYGTEHYRLYEYRNWFEVNDEQYRELLSAGKIKPYIVDRGLVRRYIADERLSIALASYCDFLGHVAKIGKYFGVMFMLASPILAILLVIFCLFGLGSSSRSKSITENVLPEIFY